MRGCFYIQNQYIYVDVLTGRTQLFMYITMVTYILQWNFCLMYLCCISYIFWLTKTEFLLKFWIVCLERENYIFSVVFFVFSGAEIRPLSQWDLGDFFSNLKKKFPISKKKKFFFFFFFFFRIFIQSPHTHHTRSQATWWQSTRIASYFPSI